MSEDETETTTQMGDITINDPAGNLLSSLDSKDETTVGDLLAMLGAGVLKKDGVLKANRSYVLVPGTYTLAQPHQQYGLTENAFKTPAPRRKVQETQSPGSLLDACSDEEDEEALVAAAKEFCQAKTKTMERPDVTNLRRKPALQDFTGVDLPHTQGKIDMRISFPEWPATPVGIQLCGEINKEFPPPGVILVGKSGCGKTSAIFEAAQQKYCILFTASCKDEMNLAPHGDPGGFDTSFSELVSRVSAVANEDATPSQKKSQCEVLILAFVVARMLLLWTFMEDHPDSSPLSWLMYQLTPDMHDQTLTMYRSLVRRREGILKNLKQQLLRKLDFFFAFDEVQHGYDILKDTQLWKSTSSEDYRGIACPVIRELTGRKTLVVAGTALRVLSIESCKSDIGKLKNTILINDFPPVSLEDIKHKLGAVLNMDQIDFEQAQLWRLEGRGRLLGGFFEQLLEATIKPDPAATKQVVFNKAVEKNYSVCLNQLVQRIKVTFGLDKDEENDKLVTGKRKLPESLEMIATASMIGSPVSMSSKRIKVDLLHIGLCSVRTLVGDSDEFVLDESLGREAVLAVAQKKDFLTHLFDKVTSLCRAAGGNAMEPLIVAELHYWGRCNSTATVQQFLSVACGDKLPEGLPEWINTAKFSVNGGYSKALCVSQGIVDDVKFIEEAVKNNDLRNLLLSPSTVKRPDFEAVMEQDGKAHWFLAVSSKLYATPFDDTDDNDFRSTKPNKFYMQKNGHPNKSCCKLRSSWENTLKGQKELFDRCLRIHVCLPEVKRPGNDKNRIFVDPEFNSIVLYITSQNVRNVFRQECIDVLKKLGCLHLAG